MVEIDNLREIIVFKLLCICNSIVSPIVLADGRNPDEFLFLSWDNEIKSAIIIGIHRKVNERKWSLNLIFSCDYCHCDSTSTKVKVKAETERNQVKLC